MFLETIAIYIKIRVSAEALALNILDQVVYSILLILFIKWSPS
jgi:hypothetical protein